MEEQLRTEITRKFKRAIKKWIGVTVNPDFFAYTGGLSGAGVYNVPLKLSFPGLSRDPIDLTVVIKLDSKHAFDQDQENYGKLEQLPNIQKYFAAFASSPEQINEEFFMVMEFLEGYNSLHNILYSITEKLAYERCITVFDAIHEVHVGDEGEKGNTGVKILCSLYFGEIEKSVRKIANKSETLRKMVLEPQPYIDSDRNAYRKVTLQECLEKLWNRREDLEPTIKTRMHGDCHGRNIMFNQDGNPRIKFIDIDKFVFEGDYIYDFGELIADLEVVGFLKEQIHFSLPPNPFEYELKLPTTVANAVKVIWEQVEQRAKKDKSEWKSRLYLAKARYLLSLVPELKKHSEMEFTTFCEGLKALQDAINELEDGTKL